MKELGMISSLGFCDLEIVSEAVISWLYPLVEVPMGRKRFLKFIRGENIDCFWITLPSQQLRNHIKDIYEE